MASLLRRQGRPIPQSIKIELLIDTGADTTTINEMHMRSLGIAPRGASEVRGITTETHARVCNTYDLSLQFVNYVGEPPLKIPVLEVMCVPFHNEVIDGVVGRDALSLMIFTLEGPHRQFVINY